jgi:hypothetical protein
LAPYSSGYGTKAQSGSADVAEGTLLRPLIPKGSITKAQLVEARDGLTVQVAGLVVVRQGPQTAKGVVFLALEDEHGQSNVIVSSRLYDVRRNVMRRPGTLNVTATDALPLLDVLQDREPGTQQDLLTAAFVADLKGAAPAARQWR